MPDREDLREQHAIGEEIADALTQGAVGANAMDEDELEEELEGLQQEELDNKMLKTGSMPIGDQIQRLPTAAGECKSHPFLYSTQTKSPLLLPESSHTCDRHRRLSTDWNCKIDMADMCVTVRGKAPAQQEEDDDEEELRKLQAEIAM